MLNNINSRKSIVQEVETLVIRKPFAFFSGLIDGIIGHAAVDENGLIQSAYIQKHRSLFRLYTADRMQKFEEKSRPLRQQGESLLFEYDLFRRELESYPASPGTTKSMSVEEIRQADRFDAERLALMEQIVSVSEELISIHNSIQSLKLKADEDLISLADRWKAAFASYSKGVLLLKHTPVRESMIPQLEYDTSTAYRRQIDDSFSQLLARIGEVKSITEKEENIKNEIIKEKIA